MSSKSVMSFALAVTLTQLLFSNTAEAQSSCSDIEAVSVELMQDYSELKDGIKLSSRGDFYLELLTIIEVASQIESDIRNKYHNGRSTEEELMLIIDFTQELQINAEIEKSKLLILKGRYDETYPNKGLWTLSDAQNEIKPPKLESQVFYRVAYENLLEANKRVANRIEIQNDRINIAGKNLSVSKRIEPWRKLVSILERRVEIETEMAELIEMFV